MYNAGYTIKTPLLFYICKTGNTHVAHLVVYKDKYHSMNWLPNTLHMLCFTWIQIQVNLGVNNEP